MIRGHREVGRRRVVRRRRHAVHGERVPQRPRRLGRVGAVVAVLRRVPGSNLVSRVAHSGWHLLLKFHEGGFPNHFLVETIHRPRHVQHGCPRALITGNFQINTSKMTIPKHTSLLLARSSIA